MVDEELRLALVDVAGVRRKVNVGLLDADGTPARSAIGCSSTSASLSKIDEAEAEATLSLLQGKGEDFEQELEELKASVIERWVTSLAGPNSRGPKSETIASASPAPTRAARSA